MAKKNNLAYKNNGDEDQTPKTLNVLEGGKLLPTEIPDLPEEIKNRNKGLLTEKRRLEKHVKLLENEVDDLHLGVESKKNEFEICKRQLEELDRNRNSILEEIKESESKLNFHVEELEKKKRALEYAVKTELSKYTQLTDNFLKTKASQETEVLRLNEERNFIQENITQLNVDLKRLESDYSTALGKLDNKVDQLSDIKSDFSFFQDKYKTLESEYENLQKDKNKLEKDIITLEAFEEDLQHQKEIEKEKIKNEIEIERRKLEHERQVSFQNLENSLRERESQWDRSFKERKNKQLRELGHQIKNIEIEILDKTREAESLKVNILDKARKEADQMRIEAGEVLRNSYTERQHVLDQASRVKMDAENKAIERVEKINNDIEKIRRAALDKEHEAEVYFQEKSREAEQVMNSAKAKANSIIQKADVEKKFILSKANQEEREIQLLLKRKDDDWQAEIENRKESLKVYLEKRKTKHQVYLNRLSDDYKIQIEKKKILLEDRLEGQKRREFKKIVQLRDKVLTEAKVGTEFEKEKFKHFKKKELKRLYDTKKTLTQKIELLKDEYETDISKYKKQQEKEQEKIKMKAAEKINALRLNLESEMESRIEKERDDFEKFKSTRAANAQLAVYNYLTKNHAQFMDTLDSKRVDGFNKDINQIITDIMDGKDIEMLEKFGIERDSIEKKNIKDVAIKYGIGFMLPGLVLAIIVFDGFSIRTGTVNLFNKTVKDQKEKSSEIEEKLVKEKQEVRVFRPKMTTYFKKTYTRNVINTIGFVETYESDSFQNDWLLAAHEFITNDLELEEEVAIDLVSTEGSLIKELNQMASEIDARFAETSIEKMEARESVAFDQVKARFGDPENWRAFNAFKIDFFREKFNK